MFLDPMVPSLALALSLTSAAPHTGELAPRAVLRHTEFVSALAFTPDGRTLLTSGGEQAIRLWDPRIGKELRRLHGHRASVSSLALSSDGKTLASGGGDGEVRLWDLSSGKTVRAFSTRSGDVASVALTADGRRLATMSSGIANQHLQVRRGLVFT
jgi:WD40 repeat protein